MKMLIGNDEVSSVSGETMDVIDPATLEFIDRVPKATVEDAARAAGMAFENRERIANIRPDERRAILARIARDIRDQHNAIARTLTLETGKPLAEANHEVLTCTRTFEYYSNMKMEEEILTDSEALRLSVIHRPVGPSALILPWNYPVALMGWKCAPAILAGNPLVLKPAPYTPLSNLMLGKILAAHMPAGTISVLPGGDDVGRALVTSGKIRRVSFTGHVDTGPRILEEIASSGLKKITLELGGNDAALVARDFDMDNMASLMWGSFRNAGQVCIAIKRIYVEEEIYDEFVKRYVEQVKSIRVGIPTREGVSMGPLNNLPQLEIVEEMIRDAVDRGGRVRTGGERLMGKDGLPGYFHSPTVITDVDESAAIVSSEQFGPVVPIVPVPDLDDAVRRVNAGRWGLGGSVWTRNLERARDIAGRMECGTCWINIHMAVEMNVPFGGVKASGSGRELGHWGLEEFTEPMTIYMKR